MEMAGAENRRYELTLPLDVGGERKWVRSVGRPRHRSSGRLQLFGTLEDVTDVVRQQKQVERKAYHDPLTGLPNEHGIERKLQTIIDEQHDVNSNPVPRIVCILEMLTAPGTPPNEIDATQRRFARAIRERGGVAARLP